MAGQKKTDPVVSALRELQQLVRVEVPLPLEEAERHITIPEDLARPGAVALDLSLDEVEVFRRVKRAIESDLPFEHLGSQISDPLEGDLTRFVCLCAVETDRDHVSDFVAKHKKDPVERICYLGVEFLKVDEPLDLFDLRVLPTDHENIPASKRWFSVEKPVESVVAVPVSGTHLTLMKDRAAAIAERALRALRIALAGQIGGSQLQLRFRLSESYSFGDLLGGWKTRPDARWSLTLDGRLLDKGNSKPVAKLALQPRTNLARRAARAAGWIEKSMIDGDPVNSLLFSFFALEAMLGNSAEGLKAHGLAYRRALLSQATRGSFPDPDNVYLLYDKVRSAAVHGEQLPEVSDHDRDGFNADVRTALDEYLELAEKKGFETRRRLFRFLGDLPEKDGLDEWLIEFGHETWARYLSREESLGDKEAAEIAKVLGHPLRLGYLWALRELGPDGMLAPSEYAHESGKPISSVAYHVKVLRAAGVLEMASIAAPRGRNDRYSLSGPRAKVAMQFLDVLAGSGR